ncbi:hypothetical protein, partial [Planktothrix agardhii]|uniref:hypothetical protein n=1 Tax=Planktothrix agardhii TaxID=1160 RepID=UPI003B99C51A
LDIVKVTNNKKKPLTKNQRILSIIFIIFGGLFVFNEFAKRIDQEGQGQREGLREYCSRLLRADIHLYAQDKDCNK